MPKFSSKQQIQPESEEISENPLAWKSNHPETNVADEADILQFNYAKAKDAVASKASPFKYAELLFRGDESALLSCWISSDSPAAGLTVHGYTQWPTSCNVLAG